VSGRAILLTAGPLAEEQLGLIEAQMQRPVVQQIVREGEIAAGLRLLSGVASTMSASPDDGKTEQQGSRPRVTRTVPLLGDLLIERGYVRRAAFDAALQDYRPGAHGRIGNYMVARNVISRDVLDNVIQEQHRLGNRVASQ
jgi:adsorption protein B